MRKNRLHIFCTLFMCLFFSLTQAQTPPQAENDFVSTLQDNAVALNITANDFDLEDGNTLDPCSVLVVTPAQNGVTYLGGSNNGCLMNYYPNSGFSGTDSFTYQICDADGLCDTAVVTVVVMPCTPPQLSLNPSPLCENQSGTFIAEYAGSAATYTWDFGFNAVPFSATGIGPHSVTYSTVGTFPVLLTTTSAGCTRSTTFYIVVNAAPTALISTAPEYLCVEEEGLFIAQVTGGTGASFNWDFGADASPPTASGIGSHSVSYPNGGSKTVNLYVTQGSCTNQAAYQLDVLDRTEVDAGEEQTICSGGTAILGTTPILNANYLWSPTTSLNSPNTANPAASPMVTTTYEMRVFKNGCESIDSVTVVVDDTPVPFVEAGPDHAICEGTTVQVGGQPTTSASGSGVIIEWTTTTGDLSTIDDPSLPNPIITAKTTEIYTVCVTNGNCTKCDDMTLSVAPAPDLTAGADVDLCKGESTILGCSPCLPYPDDATYLWTPPTGLDNPSARNPIASPTQTTTYSVQMTYNGCSSYDEVLVHVDACNDLPSAYDDFYQTDQGTGFSAPSPFNDLPSVLDNDTDPSNDLFLTPTTITSSQDPNTQVTFYSNGSFVYKPSPDFVGMDTFEYEVCDNGNPVYCATATLYISVEPCIEVQLWAFLEGAYDASTAEMTTYLNLLEGNALYRGVLPGQEPYNSFFAPTPLGQPYKISPWEYIGLEGTFDAPPYYYAPGSSAPEGDALHAVYHPDVVDWVLVRFREGPTDNLVTVRSVAALLMKDGRLEFLEPCIFKQSDLSGSMVYVQIDHRNHMAIMNPFALDITAGQLSWDFRIANSYREPTSFGQQEVQAGVWALYAGDTDQTADFPYYDINGFDAIIWSSENGNYDAYLPADVDLNADTNGSDRILILKNNGISSRVPK